MDTRYKPELLTFSGASSPQREKMSFISEENKKKCVMKKEGSGLACGLSQGPACLPWVFPSWPFS